MYRYLCCLWERTEPGLPSKCTGIFVVCGRTLEHVLPCKCTGIFVVCGRTIENVLPCNCTGIVVVQRKPAEKGWRYPV